MCLLAVLGSQGIVVKCTAAIFFRTVDWAWIKLATDNFSTVFTRNLRNPRDYAPLMRE